MGIARRKLSMIHHGDCTQSGRARTADEPVMKATKSEAATMGKPEIVTLIYMDARVSWWDILMSII